MSNETLKFPFKATKKQEDNHYSDYANMISCYTVEMKKPTSRMILYGNFQEVNNVGAIQAHSQENGFGFIENNIKDKGTIVVKVGGKQVENSLIGSLKSQFKKAGIRKEITFLVSNKENKAITKEQIVRRVNKSGRIKSLHIIADPLNVEQSISPIEKLINNSKRLLELEADWNEDGASPIDLYLYRSAINFLSEYYNFISTKLSTHIQLPNINPCPDGSVDLEWNTKNAQLLINFRFDKQGVITAFYYGDLFNNREPIKGSVGTTGIKEHLAAWMKYLS